jgi:predicted acylesterase/phospholipase RssA
MHRMNRSLARRLSPSPRARDTAVRTFALCPAHDGAPIEAVGATLLRAFSAIGSTALVNSADLEARLAYGGETDAAAFEAEVIHWLSEVEAQHRYVLLRAERDPLSDWSQRCLRQADRAFLVADAGRPPDFELLGAIEPAWRVRPDLLLLHPAGTARPRASHVWLDAVQPRLVYHLREDDTGQRASIARRLAGRGIGVVLSGGAARGYAHVGAMQALAELRVPVDVIAGTSMGALVGAGFALGRSAEEMRERAIASAARRRLLDPTLPLSAVTSGKKVSQLLYRETERERIEDLWRPYFCVSANLTRASAQVHHRGPLWKAIRASSAIPGIFPPVLAANGDVLADGGSVNNMPIDLMRERDDVGTVLAVNVAPLREQAHHYTFGASVSGWDALAAKLLHRGESPPTLFSTVMRANEVRGALLMRTKQFTDLADLIIEPPVERFPLLTFSACDEIIECGYSSASEALAVWLNGPGTAALEAAGVRMSDSD